MQQLKELIEKMGLGLSGLCVLYRKIRIRRKITRCKNEIMTTEAQKRAKKIQR